jgi:hypothetical protein
MLYEGEHLENAFHRIKRMARKLPRAITQQEEEGG